MDQITEIKQKLDIVDIISGYVSLTKSGRNYKGLCPFHGEKTPSFMVNQELQIYKCFGCGEGGDIFEFVQKIEDMDFPRALETLAERAGVKLEKKAPDEESKRKKTYYEINRLSTEFFHFMLTKHPAGKRAKEYFIKKRKISEKTIEEFSLGYAPDTWDTLYRFLAKKGFKPEDILNSGVTVKRMSGDGFIDKFRGRVIFPLIDADEKVVGFNGRTILDKEPKYLNTAETPIFHKGSFVYGLSKARVAIKQDGAVFVEGPLDVISAHQMGIKNVVASSGTSLTQDQLKLISRYSKDISFCFDTDTAGAAAMQRAIGIAEKMDFNIRVAMVPDKYKDLDEFINGNPDEAKALLKKPVPVYDFYVASSLKRSNKETALGKKQIMEELSAQFSKVQSPVVKDHYAKLLAGELNLDVEIINSLFNKKISVEKAIPTAAGQKDKEIKMEVVKRSPEEYILALLLKTPLDSAQTTLYKLAQKDFQNDTLREIFTDLKEYLIGRKRKFDIKYFSNQLSKEKQQIVEELYLWDLGDLTEDTVKFEKELEWAFDRIKVGTVKKELKELTEKIKQAELEKDTEKVKELTQKLQIISERLLNHA